jgi:branched-chain amino acid aminotransferase
MHVTSTPKIWLDGAITDLTNGRIPLLTHSLFYGSAVFEGIRCYSTLKGPAVFRLEEHIHHLFHSSKAMGMASLYTEAEIASAVIEVIKQNNFDYCYIRPIFFYGEKMDLVPLGAPLHIAVAAWQWGKYLARETVAVKVTPYIRVHPHSREMTAKIAGNYTNSILALLDAQKRGYEKALFLDENNCVAEGAGENIFFVQEDFLHTPTDRAILPGITRASVMQIATDLGYEIVERDIPFTEISKFSEAFFTGTAAEVNAIGKIDKHIFCNMQEGPTVRKIKLAYQRAVHGEDKRYKRWLHPVL